MSNHLGLYAFACWCALGAAPAAAQAVYSNARVSHVGVHNAADANVEVTFDRDVCAVPQGSKTSFLLSTSANRDFLLSVILSAFTSHRPVQIQTVNDGSCRILTLSVSK